MGKQLLHLLEAWGAAKLLIQKHRASPFLYVAWSLADRKLELHLLVVRWVLAVRKPLNSVACAAV